MKDPGYISLPCDRRYRSPNYNDRPILRSNAKSIPVSDMSARFTLDTDLNTEPDISSQTVPHALIDMIVLHYTGMKTAQAALERLCDKEAGVSAHYLISEEGHIYALVDEEKRAFHAGISHWAGRDNVNDYSIGIEIANKGHWWGYEPFPETQIKALIALIRQIKQTYDIPVNRIVGHSDIAPDRKEDPGELFPWDRLAAEGLAIGTYDPQRVFDEPVALPYEACLDQLVSIGYKIEGPNHGAAVLAFQRRFCPSALGQGLNELTRNAIAFIASLDEAPCG